MQVVASRQSIAPGHPDAGQSIAQAIPFGHLMSPAHGLHVDPQANVQMNLSCVRCGKHWQAVFDIESFLWSEINRWAERLLLEVHQLARAYGWREADILAMSPHRRRFYLDMLGK